MTESSCSARDRTPYTWPPETVPSDEQVAEWLAACTPEERLERVVWWREQGNVAQRCWLEDHVRRLEQVDPRPGSGRHRAF